MKAILTGLVATPLLLTGWVLVQFAWQRTFGEEISKGCGTADACGSCCKRDNERRVNHEA